MRKLFEHRHHLVNEVGTGRFSVTARIKQAKRDAIAKQLSHSTLATTASGTATQKPTHSRAQLLVRNDPPSHRIYPVSSTSIAAQNANTTVAIGAADSPDVLPSANDDEAHVEELSDSYSDSEDEGSVVVEPPTYSGLLPHEQTMRWLLDQKFYLYFHGSRIWANHEDLRRIPGKNNVLCGGWALRRNVVVGGSNFITVVRAVSCIAEGTIVSGGMLEHDVDAILMDLLLYDDLELALKALTLLIQKYDL